MHKKTKSDKKNTKRGWEIPTSVVKLQLLSGTIGNYIVCMTIIINDFRAFITLTTGFTRPFMLVSPGPIRYVPSWSYPEEF